MISPSTQFYRRGAVSAFKCKLELTDAIQMVLRESTKAKTHCQDRATFSGETTLHILSKVALALRPPSVGETPES